MILVTDLCKEYQLGWLRPRRVSAVEGLSLSIDKGEVFGLLGPNGAGKTTTIKLLCGLLQPTSGHIAVEGRSVTASHPPRRLVGAVLEGNRNTYWNLSCWENLMYFARTRGVRMPEARSRASELLVEFSLESKRKDPVGSLSRGMQQKLALCCALISDPPVLLVDEPTLGLDIAAARLIREQIHELSKVRGKTVLLTTHNMELAAEVCDRIGVMSNGAMVRCGRVDEFRNLLSSVRTCIDVAGQLSDGVRRVISATKHVSVESSGEKHAIWIETDSTTGIPFETLDSMLHLIAEDGLQLNGLRTERPSLEEAFVQLTEGGSQ